MSSTNSDLDLLELRAIDQAQRSFYAFRQYLHVNTPMRWGWFHQHLARTLQAFLLDIAENKRPILALTVPPQHGKSMAVTDFITWTLAQQPLRVIYGSYADDLGAIANERIYRATQTDAYNRVFTRRPERRTNEIIVYPDGGHFVHTTVRGPITGRAMDLGIIDDPHKNREEANSLTIRDKVWKWYTDDFSTRASETSGTVVIMTRWHLDDLIGRILESDDAARVKMVSFPAIAEGPEEHRKSGDALFPALKSVAFLAEMRGKMLESSWSALYQQRPITQGGGMFPVERFQILDIPPVSDTVVDSVRYWDKAGTHGGDGAQTAGVLMHRLADGRYYIEDVVSGRWSALDRENHILATAKADGRGVAIWTEQEPGSGGKESAEATVRMLSGWKIYTDRVTGSKTTRAEPYAAQVQGGNVLIRRANWTRGFLDQHEHFPAGKLKDTVDAAAGAFAKLFRQRKTAGTW